MCSYGLTKHFPQRASDKPKHTQAQTKAPAVAGSDFLSPTWERDMQEPMEIWQLISYTAWT